MKKKANVIEAHGVIFKESGNGYFNVELDEPRSFHLNLSNQVIQVPIAPANTPPRV